ncbi:diaminopropionate ammonia-lyase [Acidihalobacter ferrooxydans]|uniref:Diaminopropionate ammonia-lyase n=1 Tax=Acidihalobacter ferrooxydans TaxID=1765967 RepID=A0A1P8UG37_9GAMM|nr:diaminopropionate ammonia-lyase [Acidihalobacter ferrooxydans]APZ42780.1 diaminopropionate ammonia-lyase [Acidihalobacter ferrooxydans]
MYLLSNPLRLKGLAASAGLAQGAVVADPCAAQALFSRCPRAARTPLRELPQLAKHFAVGELWVKDESERLGLGSFKALGAAHAIAREAAQRVEAAGGESDADVWREALAGEVLVCASAGNHGLSVAAGARIFGARAVVYLSRAVPEAFAERLRARGAQVCRAGDTYEDSMAAAAADAQRYGWTLLSDTTWPGYVEWPQRVMEGYLILGAEALEQLPAPATHVFVQAGVGGFAAAMTALLRAHWGDAPRIVVVEPASAPALLESVRAGRAERTAGPTSVMGRMDCKEPSHLALAELAREADAFVTLTDAESLETVAAIAQCGLVTTPSGAAGISALHHADAAARAALGLDRDSRVLAFMTEGPEDAT